jgi:putative nucleotidyltransferase with HDIG domain
MLFSKFFKSDQKITAAAKRTLAQRKNVTATKSRKTHEKVDVRDLRVGMDVVQLDKPWEESGFMFQSVEIASTADIEAVSKECSFVWVDFDEYNLPDTSKPVQTQQPRLIIGSTAVVIDEIKTATNIQSMASTAVSSLFDDIRLGEELDGTEVKQAVSGCVDSILRNQDASLWLTRMQAKDAGTVQHSMNVSALSIIMAKAIGLNNQEMEDVGVCGMLHDVGKTRVPNDLIEKVNPLDPEEIAEMQRHTTYGRDILLSTQNVMSVAADVAYSHHERPDGLGFPQGLKDDQIPVYSKIVAIADAYDNMTRNKPYRTALSPSHALQELYQLRGKQFDDELVVLFIDSVGIFPPGSIVEMVNKEVGIVLANTADKLRPRVIMILDSIGEPAMQRVVDLSRLEIDNEGKVYQVKTTHSDGTFGINVGEFQRAGLRIG